MLKSVRINYNTHGHAFLCIDPLSNLMQNEVCKI